MNHRIRIGAALSVLVLLGATLVSAAAPPQNTRPYLVALRPGKSGKDMKIAGMRITREWPELGAVKAVVTSAAGDQLRAHGAVEFMEEDRPVRAMADTLPFADTAEIPWGLKAVHAQDAWAMGATGEGVSVCIVDTGIDLSQPEFMRGGASIVKANANFVPDGHPNAQDGNGHGTHVAGTIAAQPNGTGVTGVAPGVNLYVARVLDDDGSGSTESVISGVNWCVDQGARIISLSLGSSTPSKIEQRAFDRAWSMNRIVVAAAGNDGSLGASYPANYSAAIAVGAVDSSLQLASFSNFGPKQELVAPGVTVLSSVPIGFGRTSSAAAAGVSFGSNGLELAGMGTVTGPLVECGLATDITSCTGAPASGDWVALITRGSITFASKVTNVMAQGAKAAIITNNDTANPTDPGGFTLGPGTWIPAVSVSFSSGQAIRAAGLGTAEVSVTTWDYAFFSGTSMATPHVSAVAALAWGAKPTLSNGALRQVLGNSALDLGSKGRDFQFGFGMVQAGKAVELAKSR